MVRARKVRGTVKNAGKIAHGCKVVLVRVMKGGVESFFFFFFLLFSVGSDLGRETSLRYE